MSTAKLKLFLITAVCIFTAIQSRASHIMGGEITYRWITGNDYAVTLILYRECSGIPLPTIADIGMMSGTCQDTLQGALPLIMTEQITPGCSANASTCNGGAAFGYERGVYMDTVTLPSNCDDWIFVYGTCCRNSAITNLAVPGSGSYFYATLDNQNTPFNNSPVFTASPIVFLTAGQSYTLNNGVFDPDGDSLVMSLSPALDEYNGLLGPPLILTYSGSFTYLNPVTSTPPLAIDPQTGTITVSPTLAEVDVVVYKVEEYRNGILIGTTTRDLQVIIEGGSNQLPNLSGVNGGNNFSINVCYTDTLQFNITSMDFDFTDTTTIPWHLFTGSNYNGTNYSFVTGGTLHANATFSFIPDSSMISSQPYYLYVAIKDDACPYYGFQIYCYAIYVNSCSQEVWPGDANSDLQVNLYDVLPIGLAYNDNGPVRTGASLAWIAQPATDWANSFISGVNHKHADTNGDGTVDNADTTAISLNYGQSHPAKFALPEITSSTIADLYLVASPDTALANNIVNVKICLGTSALPIDSIYGIAFRINFDPALIDSTSGSFNYTGSWMGTQGSDLLTFDRKFMPAGFAEAAMVRTDQTNISGDSTIAVFSIVIVDNIAGKTGMPLYLSDVYAITYNEAILNFNLIGDTIIINTITGIDDQAGLAGQISVYPVPASTTLHIKAGNEKIEKVILSDLSGRKIIVINESLVHETTLDLSGISKGTYLVTIETPSGTLNKRITVTGK